MREEKGAGVLAQQVARTISKEIVCPPNDNLSRQPVEAGWRMTYLVREVVVWRALASLLSWRFANMRTQTAIRDAPITHAITVTTCSRVVCGCSQFAAAHTAIMMPAIQ